MKTKTEIENQEGFTIIEILVGSVVFMLGFSLLVFMLNQMMTRQSIRDVTTATHLASEVMEKSMVFHDVLPIDSTVTVSGIAYHLEKNVHLDSSLVSVKIQVSRLRESRELCRMYGEFDTQ